MREAAMLAMIFGASWVAFGCLALGQAPHWRAVVEAKDCSSITRWLLRISGVLFLAAGLMLSLAHEGLSYGLLLWTTSLTMTAFCVVVTLAFRPRLLRPLAWICHVPSSGTNSGPGCREARTGSEPPRSSTTAI
jgi:hypothetical protein